MMHPSTSILGGIMRNLNIVASAAALLTLTACSSGTSSAKPAPAPTVTVTVTATMSDQEVLDAADQILDDVQADVDAGVEPSVSLPAAPTPEGPLSSLTDGTYLVGEDIKAGTYKTGGSVGGGCYWARNRDDSGEGDAIIANHFGDGPSRVTVNKGEVFETRGCQEWTLVK